MVKLESDFRAGLPARGSSAFGLCQLLKAERVRFKLGHSIDVERQAAACAVKTEENLAAFRNHFGREPTFDEAYLVHWQGFGGAKAIMTAGEREHLVAVLNRLKRGYGNLVARANRSIARMTVVEYRASIGWRMSAALAAIGA